MRIKLALALALLPAMLWAQGQDTVFYHKELPPAVVIGGKTKEKVLVRPGSKVADGHATGAISLRSEDELGRELGSVVQVKKPFLVKDITFRINENTIPGCVAAINIYRMEESLVNVLQKPIHFDVAVSDSPQRFNLHPNETLLLEPGRYFIAFQIVDCDRPAFQRFLAKPAEEQDYWEFSMYFTLHLKSSYTRETARGDLKSYPFNMGIAVKGLEYQ